VSLRQTKNNKQGKLFKLSRPGLRDHDDILPCSIIKQTKNKKPEANLKVEIQWVISISQKGQYQPEYRFEYIFQWSGRSWQEIILHQKNKKNFNFYNLNQNHHHILNPKPINHKFLGPTASLMISCLGPLGFMSRENRIKKA